MSTAGELANGDSLAYWEGAAQRRLMFQKCRSCGALQFPPRHHCATCWNSDPDWIQSSGKGMVESYTIVHRSPVPQFRDRVPYAIVAVRVEEGPRMITTLLGEGALDVRIGDPVTVDFAANASGTMLPVFRRV